MALTYSRFFKVKHKDFLQKGVYNAFFDQDSLLHIDPLLLKGCEIPEFKNAYAEFFTYFRLFIPLVKASKADNLQDHFFKKMVNRFTFKEIPNTGLGFSYCPLSHLSALRALRHGRHLFPAGLHISGVCPDYGLCRWYRRSLCILHPADQWRR